MVTILYNNGLNYRLNYARQKWPNGCKTEIMKYLKVKNKNNLR